MNLKLALIALLAVGLALVSASTAERAAGAIPVEAEDAEMVALDAEADEALKLVGTGRSAAVVEAGESFDALDAEMGVADLSLDSNTDLSMPVDADSADEHVGEDEALDADEDVAFVAESESVSIAVADDAEAQEESVSAAVDSDENASFLQLSEADSDESEDEEEAEDEDEAEDEAEDEEEDEDSDEAEGEDEEAVQTALIEQIVEADVDAEADAEAVAMTDAGVELVADAETAVRVAANVDTGVVTAEEDVASEASHAVDMVDVSDFDVAKLAAKDQEVVRTAGGVTAGLADATIEESGVAADAAPYDADVVAVVSDKVARAAAGAAAMVEVGAATATAAEAEAEMAAPFTPPTAEQQAEEQQHLDLMHSVLIQLRKEQGRPLNDEMTPADMDAIEEKMATLSLVEVSAAADAQTQAAATADADAAHPRDHTVLVTAVVPEVQDTTPGAKLSPATIITPPQPVKPPKSPYRWDVQYRADKRQFLPHDGVELVENAHPLHRRDPTAASKLRNPVKPGVWDRRPWETTPKQQYRYDVTYEKRSACCRRREACCIRGVDTKTVVAKVKKPVRIVDPSKPEPQPQPKKADDKNKAKKADTKKAKMVKPKRAFRYDVQYEAERSKCCAAKSVCCAPPQAMYRADVQYAAGGDADAWVVVSPSGERGVVVEVDADELQMLSRIQQRQALLHKLLLTHDSPYYYDDHFDGIAMVPADAAHIVQFHEPRAASDPQQLTAAEQAELNAWMAQLPVVPHLSVVETSAAAHAAQGAVFLQTEAEADAEAVAEEAAARRLIPARVLKGFVDVQQKPENLASLLSALPPMPAAAEEQVDEMEEAMAAAEADAENDDL